MMTVPGAAPSGSVVGGSSAGTRWSVLILCFLVAVVEGIEIVSFGVAAPDLRVSLGLDPAAVGFLASAGVVGLIFGAFFGGRLADRIGSKRLLVLSVLGSALFTLASSLSYDFTTMLIARLLTGMAVGVTMPNVIALGAEAGTPRGQVTRVSIITAGTPAGGVVMGLFAATSFAIAWQSAFWFGTAVPLVLLPFLALFLPADRPPAKRAAIAGASEPQHLASYRTVLFGERRAWATSSLWVSGFANQVIIYLLLNWLPTLMRAAGTTREEGAMAMALFNIGGVLGGFVFGPFMRRTTRWPVPVISYAGIVIGLLGLLLPGPTVDARLIASLLAGACAIGSQLLIFGLSAETYDKRHRGTGVGAATAVGRIGSTAGPVVAGVALSAGATAATILPALLPLALLAGGGCLILALRRPANTD